MANESNGMISIVQRKSTIGQPKRTRLWLKSLGLRGIGHTVLRQDNSSMRGLIHKVQHLIEVLPAAE